MKNTKRIDGFSMIELLVAITIIAIGILAVAGLMPLGRRTTLESGDVTRAVEYAQQKMEELKHDPYQSLIAGSDSVGKFVRSWEVDDDFPMDGMKRVTMKVAWEAGMKDTVKLRTYIGER